MKYFFAVITCLFAQISFAQHDMHAGMNMTSDMNMGDNSHLPTLIKRAVIKSWGASNLFQTKLDTTSLVYLKGEQEHTVTIRAFQQKFYDDPAVLKPVWVLGYVANESDQPPSLPGPVIETEVNHPSKIFWVNKVYETLEKQPGYQLYPDYDSAKEQPYVPLIYNINDPLHIPMVADALYPDFMQFPNGVNPMHEKYLDMSTYYSTTVHVHGANVTWQNDGYPTSKYFPTPGAAPVNITWGLFGKFEENKTGQHYFYPNTLPEGQHALIRSKMNNTAFSPGNAKYEGAHGAILWYHDHAMMRTATDIYAGMAGVYIINGEDEKAFSSVVKYSHDIPLLLQDKSFTESGYLYYNTTATKVSSNTPDDEAEGQPEFMGNTITVNGKIWPYMNVDQTVYRFRIVNASTTRFYRLAIARWKDGKIDTANNAMLSANFIQVGTEGGFIPDGNFPRIGNDNSALTLAPSERADVLINFSSFEPGTSLVLLNYAPDGPYGDDYLQIFEDGKFSDLTNYVMAFHIQAGNNSAKATNENALNNELKIFAATSIYKQTTGSQRLFSYYKNNSNFKGNLQKALNAVFENTPGTSAGNHLSSLFPKEAEILSNAATYRLKLTEAASYQDLPAPYKKYFDKNPMLQNELAFPMSFMNETDWNVEAHTPDTGTTAERVKVVNNFQTEVWAIWNGTDDAHPIHIHLNRFRILGRQKADENGHPLPGAENFSLPEPNEIGWKDVVRAKPGYINYIAIQYVLYDPTQEGQFVYHCHIAEHEDMSMMRRLVIKPTDASLQYVLSSY